MRNQLEWWVTEVPVPPPPSSHCERYPLPLSRKALTRLIMINQRLRRLNPFCGATHSSQQGLVLNLVLLPAELIT